MGIQYSNQWNYLTYPIHSEFCGNSTFAASYGGITGDYAGYNVVAYFSEYGCNQPYPRPWEDAIALFSSSAAPVWSGGIAFSYFPASSDAGQFGMVNISADGSTVTTSTDYSNLQAAYGSVTFINDPPLSNAPTASYPSCPGQNSSFLASTSLPPTPNDAACKCLQANLDCQFNPQTNNITGIVGPLLDTACGLIGQTGGNCNALSANGSSGTYGLVASCDPCNVSHIYAFTSADVFMIASKLSFAMSIYYEANKRNAQACSFAGNGTVNSKASSSSATAVASSCLASATGTNVPTSPASASQAGSSPSGSGSGKKGAATSVLVGDSRALLGVFLMVAVSVVGGVLSLA